MRKGKGGSGIARDEEGNKKGMLLSKKEWDGMDRGFRENGSEVTERASALASLGVAGAADPAT